MNPPSGREDESTDPDGIRDGFANSLEFAEEIRGERQAASVQERDPGCSREVSQEIVRHLGPCPGAEYLGNPVASGKAVEDHAAVPACPTRKQDHGHVFQGQGSRAHTPRPGLPVKGIRAHRYLACEVRPVQVASQGVLLALRHIGLGLDPQ